jgi:hypothetical protein
VRFWSEANHSLKSNKSVSYYLLKYNHTYNALCHAFMSVYRSRRIRKVLGGSMRQAGIVAAAGVYALDNCVQRLSDDHKNAKKISYGMIVYLMTMP